MYGAHKPTGANRSHQHHLGNCIRRVGYFLHPLLSEAGRSAFQSLTISSLLSLGLLSSPVRVLAQGRLYVIRDLVPGRSWTRELRNMPRIKRPALKHFRVIRECIPYPASTPNTLSHNRIVLIQADCLGLREREQSHSSIPKPSLISSRCRRCRSRAWRPSSCPTPRCSGRYISAGIRSVRTRRCSRGRDWNHVSG